MADDDIISVGEVDNPVEKIFVRHRSRRIVRIIDPKKLGLLGNLHGNRIEIGQELIVFSQRQKVVLTAVEVCTDMIDGVASAFQEFFDYRTWCRNVRITDTKVD